MPSMPPSSSISAITLDLSAREILSILKKFGSISARASNELVCSVVPCPVCHAEVDQGCATNRAAHSTGSLHADRRSAAEDWRGLHRAEWVALREEWMLWLIQIQIDKIPRP
jgi:hypothetical protein